MKTSIRDQRGFLMLVVVVAAARLVLSWGRPPGSVQIGITVLGLWAVGAVWAALIQSRRRRSRSGDLLGMLGVQNLFIQLLVVLPATLAGVVRLIRSSPDPGGMAFVSNAVVTVVVVPLLGALVMTFTALAVAVPVRALLGRRVQKAAAWLLVAMVVAACAPQASSQDDSGVETAAEESMRIEKAWIVEPIPGMQTTVAYMSVVNRGTESEVLIGVETDLAAAAQVHEMIEDEGMMQMRPLERVVIAAGETVTLAPGGMHLMLVDLARRPSSGETVSLRLRFESGARNVEAMVRGRQEGAPDE